MVEVLGLRIYQWDIIFNKVRYLENHNETSDLVFFIGPVRARAKLFVQGPLAKKIESGDIIEKNLQNRRLEL